ncbi:MAG: DUF3566 domain-containing protein [Propionibacteriaceae bacterium]|nr:DUF3566 domain-containing protein [Propionibacteriaceae bacterium]
MNSGQTGSTEPGGVGKSITQSFINRVNRMKGDLDPEIEMASPVAPPSAPAETPVEVPAASVDLPTPAVAATPVEAPAVSSPSAPEVSPLGQPNLSAPAVDVAPAVTLGGLKSASEATTAEATGLMDPPPEMKTAEKKPPKEPKKPREPKPTVASTTVSKTTRQTRRARLRISRVDPWSVMKTALLFGVAGWIMFIVATWIVFAVLDMTGLYEAINDTVAQIFASPDRTEDFNIREYINTTRATALAALVGAVNVVIMTALATIFAFLYNLTAVVMGGIEVTMAED